MAGVPQAVRPSVRVASDEWLIWALLVIGFLIGAFKLQNFGWAAYVAPDALTALLLLILVQRRGTEGLPIFAPTRMTAPILLLAGYCLLELANPDAPIVRSLLGIRSWLLYLGLYFVGYELFTSVRQLQRLYVVLLVLGSLTAAYGIRQWFAGPLAFAGWSEYYARYAGMVWTTSDGTHVFRAFSTYVTPGVFGSTMAHLTVIGLGICVSRCVTGMARLLTAGAIIVMVAGIAVTGSRAPLVHLLLMAALLPVLIPNLLPKIKKTATALLISSIAVVVLLASPIAPAVAERFGTLLEPQPFVELWMSRLAGGFRQAVENPFGAGLGYTAGVPQFLEDPLFENLPTTNVDSGYGSAAVEFGIVGLICFMYFSVKVGTEGVRAWRRLPHGQTKDLLLGPALWAASFPIWAVVAPPQATLPASIYSWLLVGMLVKAAALQPRDACESDLRSRGARPRTAMAGTSSSLRRSLPTRLPSRSGRARSRMP